MSDAAYNVFGLVANVFGMFSFAGLYIFVKSMLPINHSKKLDEILVETRAHLAFVLEEGRLSDGNFITEIWKELDDYQARASDFRIITHRAGWCKQLKGIFGLSFKIWRVYRQVKEAKKRILNKASVNESRYDNQTRDDVPGYSVDWDDEKCDGLSDSSSEEGLLTFQDNARAPGDTQGPPAYSTNFEWTKFDEYTEEQRTTDGDAGTSTSDQIQFSALTIDPESTSTTSTSTLVGGCANLTQRALTCPGPSSVVWVGLRLAAIPLTATIPQSIVGSPRRM
ncbi:uncharacterized protein C8Q71DRAFT_724074 [Rhodofomes roseus]|uniref:Uncharacterized protein n=1 Tax=Rhodofomes roseus TaxID=34475 RepID=A0ABQ8KFF9_9APHY|nr:uncharacterized protein C8Q71DRAFT_724074 [Rhodofomes roseus]KAH9836243.1 hypothetical protein C8Q71DRAFT_724074 [Rhodofomes roseus]